MEYHVKSFNNMKMTIQIGHPQTEQDDSSKTAEASERKKRKRLKRLRRRTSSSSQTSDSGVRHVHPRSPALPRTEPRDRAGQPAIKQEPEWDDSLVTATGFSFCTFSTDHLMTCDEETGWDARNTFVDTNSHDTIVKKEPGLSTSDLKAAEQAAVFDVGKTQKVDSLRNFGSLIKTEPDDGFGSPKSAYQDSSTYHLRLESDSVSDSSRTDTRATVSNSFNTVPSVANAARMIPGERSWLHPDISAPVNSVFRLTSGRTPPVPPTVAGASACESGVKPEVTESLNSTASCFETRNRLASHTQRNSLLCAPAEIRYHVHQPETHGRDPHVFTSEAGDNQVKADVGAGKPRFGARGSESRQAEEDRSFCSFLRTQPESVAEGGGQPSQIDRWKIKHQQMPVFRPVSSTREMSPFFNLQNPNSSGRPTVSQHDWTRGTGNVSISHQNPLSSHAGQRGVCFQNTPGQKTHHHHYSPQATSVHSAINAQNRLWNCPSKAYDGHAHKPSFRSLLHNQPRMQNTWSWPSAQKPPGRFGESTSKLRNPSSKSLTLPVHLQYPTFIRSGVPGYSEEEEEPGRGKLSNNIHTQRGSVSKSPHRFQNPVPGAFNTTAVNEPSVGTQDPASSIGSIPKHVCGMCRMEFSTQLQCILHVKRSHMNCAEETRFHRTTIPLKVARYRSQIKGLTQGPAAAADGQHQTDAAGLCDENVIRIDLVDHQSESNRARSQCPSTPTVHSDGNRTDDDDVQRSAALETSSLRSVEVVTTNPTVLNAQMMAATTQLGHPSGNVHTCMFHREGSRVKAANKGPLQYRSYFGESLATAASSQESTVAGSIRSRQFRDGVKYTKRVQIAHHKAEWYTCRSCQQFFTDVERHLTQDGKAHQVQRINSWCCQCGKTFPDLHALQRHLPVHCANEALRCRECGKVFTHAYWLEVHQRTHRLRKDHKCGVCGKLFLRQEYLGFHMRGHTVDLLGVKPFVCKFCQKSFSNSSNLAAHRWTHSGEKPYVCSVCQAAFATSSTLTLHSWRHTDARPSRCEVCLKRFAASNTYKRHETRHTGRRDAQYHVCGQTFSQPGSLIVHARLHSRERPFRCARCGAGFTPSGHLTAHARQQLTGAYPRSQYLLKHCRGLHGQVVPSRKDLHATEPTEETLKTGK